jgi:hypothetical protein
VTGDGRKWLSSRENKEQKKKKNQNGKSRNSLRNPFGKDNGYYQNQGKEQQ